jgi:hypothetical protein
MEMEMVMMMVVVMVFVVFPVSVMYDPKPVPNMASKTDY